MIDSHCHFDFPDFDLDRQSVWQAAHAQGVSALLIPATEWQAFDKLTELAKHNPHFYYALGLHPWFLTSDSLALLPKLENWIENNRQDPQFIAIGETGLDFAIDVAADVQEKSFLQHLELATQFSLPVIVHHRKSHNRLIQLLKQFPDVTGVIHAFSGSIHEAKTYIDMGFMLGIGGTITYQRSIKTQQAIQAVGIEHLLLETDAPAMPMAGRQGQRNSPEYLPYVVKALANILGIENSVVEKTTSANFYRLFTSANSQSSHLQAPLG